MRLNRQRSGTAICPPPWMLVTRRKEEPISLWSPRFARSAEWDHSAARIAWVALSASTPKVRYAEISSAADHLYVGDKKTDRARIYRALSVPHKWQIPAQAVHPSRSHGRAPSCQHHSGTMFAALLIADKGENYVAGEGCAGAVERAQASIPCRCRL